MNLTDDDGDTPLYVVENVETARYLVERGAVVDRRNHEHVTVCLLPLRGGPNRSFRHTFSVSHLSTYLKTSLKSRPTSNQWPLRTGVKG